MQFKILSRSLVAVVGCIAFTGVANDAFAQQNSLFGASGVSGGPGGVSSGAVGSTAFPTSKFPGGGTAAGTGQLTGTGAQQGMGATGQQGGLIGQTAGPLIGTGAPAGMTQPGQNGQMGNRQGQPNRNNANRRTGQNRNQGGNQAGGAAAANQQKTTVRPQLVVAFDHPSPDAETMRTSITTRFSKLASKSQFKDVKVETDGDVVVLRGEVDSPRTSRLAAIHARMEPGVKNVRNELTVTEPAPAPSATE